MVEGESLAIKCSVWIFATKMTEKNKCFIIKEIGCSVWIVI